MHSQLFQTHLEWVSFAYQNYQQSSFPYQNASSNGFRGRHTLPHTPSPRNPITKDLVCTPLPPKRCVVVSTTLSPLALQTLDLPLMHTMFASRSELTSSLSSFLGSWPRQISLFDHHAMVIAAWPMMVHHEQSAPTSLMHEDWPCNHSLMISNWLLCIAVLSMSSKHFPVQRT